MGKTELPAGIFRGPLKQPPQGLDQLKILQCFAAMKVFWDNQRSRKTRLIPVSKAETFISSCFSLCFSLLIIPNHWDYDLYFPVTFYIRDGPALNPFPDLLTKEITDPIKLISLLYSYSCSLFISTVFLPISSQMSCAYIMFSPFILLIAITSLKSLLYHVPYYRTDLYACKVLHNLAPPQVKYFFRGFSLSCFILSLKAFLY